MNLFEYVGVLGSIVVGLALAHILTGVSRTLQALGRIRVYWVHSVWTLNITVYLVFFWWFMYHWSGVESWDFFLFVFLLLYAVTLYLISALLFPGEVSPGFDFKEHYFQNKRWVFGFLSFAYVLDTFETTTKAALGLKEIAWLWNSPSRPDGATPGQRSRSSSPPTRIHDLSPGGSLAVDDIVEVVQVANGRPLIPL
jgi:hypothetical protein